MMSPSHDDAIRLGAAKALANKYIPDRQSIDVSNPFEDELPPELAAIGDRTVNEIGVPIVTS